MTIEYKIIVDEYALLKVIHISNKLEFPITKYIIFDSAKPITITIITVFIYQKVLIKVLHTAF